MEQENEQIARTDNSQRRPLSAESAYQITSMLNWFVRRPFMQESKKFTLMQQFISSRLITRLQKNCMNGADIRKTARLFLW